MLHSKDHYRKSRAIQIYNSLGGSKVSLDPLDPSEISPELKLYVCGLTPQDHSHVGHGFTAMRFDIIRRYLSYRNLNVNFIQNVTDIDDKIIAKELAGEEPMAMTRRFTDEFYSCCDRLHVLPPERLTRVTDFVPQIIAFIEQLIERELAYATPEGNVYFDVAKKDDYGKLSNQNTEMLYESVRKELDKEKHSPLDFALWKRDEKSTLSRPSPWGIGRPGWHIECSVMIYETLGARIDIHGGGLDLKFPHHENEIAQSEAHTGAPLANIWMHAGLLNIDGQKMSKSLNNFIRLVDALDQYGVAPLRFVVARHHYRSAIDLTDKLFRDNLNSLLDFHRLFERLDTQRPLSSAELSLPECVSLMSAFEAAMDNDFNSPEALVALEQERSRIQGSLDAGKEDPASLSVRATLVRELGKVLGVFHDPLAVVEESGLRLIARMLGADAATTSEIGALIQERSEARGKKDFARSDEIRKGLMARGVELLDSKAGTSWRFA